MAYLTNIKNETYTLREAMKEDDFSKFLEAMNKEMVDYEKNDWWEIVPRSLIGNIKVLKAI